MKENVNEKDLSKVQQEYLSLSKEVAMLQGFKLELIDVLTKVYDELTKLCLETKKILEDKKNDS